MVQLYTTLVAPPWRRDTRRRRPFATQRFAPIRATLVEQIKTPARRRTHPPDLDADQVAALVIAASDGLQTQWLLDPDVDQVGALALLERLLADVLAPGDTDNRSRGLA